MSSKSNLFWLVAGMAIASAPLARTMAQADATQVQMADGTVMAAVPTELWNTLSVQNGSSGSHYDTRAESRAGKAAR